MQAHSFSKLAATTLITTALVACGGDNSNSDRTRDINLEFAAQLNSEVLQCGDNAETVGTAQTAPDVSYFGAYISELQVASDNGEFRTVTLNSGEYADTERGISLITFCGTTDLNDNVIKNAAINGSVSMPEDEANNISRVRFTIGVPEQFNHLDATQTEGILAQEIAMHWNWTAGYKHARMDVAGWNIHLGSTNCVGENADAQCNNGNRPTYTFDNVDLNTDKVVLDYAALVNNSDISTNTENTPPGCMSRSDDPECGQVFTALGLNLANGQCLNNDCDAQSWVRMENR